MGTDQDARRPLTASGASVAAFLDFDEVLRRVVVYASESAGTEASSIILHDGAAHEFVVAAVSGPTADQMRGRRFPDTTGVAAAVLTSGEPRIVSDRQQGGGLSLSEIDQAASGRVRSLMAAPLKIGSRILGVVQTVNRRDGGEFVSTDLERFVNSCNLIAVAVENASLYRFLDNQHEILQRSRQDQAHPLIAESPAMRRALHEATLAAAGRTTILILGETGTGKEQVARRIHEASPRANGPFVPLNSAALPEGLLESELFGHEKGAFTGADRRRLGRFELADGGTLFLDEIGDLPAGAQVKLLRVLQERQISRVGGNQSIPVNVRLITATHRDLPAEVQAGRFREDLFFRIHVVPIQLPPLRDRPEDVEPLVVLFLDRFARELGRAPRTITPEALALLRVHRWPGNVRELENLIERLVVLGGGGDAIAAAELARLLPEERARVERGDERTDSPAATSTDRSLWEQERALLVDALERAGQNQTRAATLLKISREQLRTRMKRYGLLPQKTETARPA